MYIYIYNTCRYLKWLKTLIFGEETPIYKLFQCEHKGYRVLTHNQRGSLEARTWK